MTTDDLDSKSDRELDELFAVEVGCHIRPAKGHRLIAEDGYLLILDRKGKRVSKHATPAVTTDANAVLPWLSKFIWEAQGHAVGFGNTCRVWLPGTVVLEVKSHAGSSPTFPRAAVLALLRAKRAEKSA